MNCDDARPLLDAYIDGELDLVRNLEIEKHLAGCDACSKTVASSRAIGAAMRSANFYYQPPNDLQQRLDSALSKEMRTTVMPRRAPHRWPFLATAAAAVLAVFFVTRSLVPVVPGGPGDSTAQEVLDSHLRSLLPNHLADVASSDRHTVKPWFNGKLDFSPPTVDFAEQGFPLVGGRLDALSGRTVAALVYRRNQHVINAYVWPAAGNSDTANVTQSKQGYNLIHWTHAGMNWWLSSDLNTAELESLAGLLRAQAQ